MKKTSIYITFDGLSDPLGQSQILPYLKMINCNKFQLKIFSLEKKITKKNIFFNTKIEWRYIEFEKRKNKLLKFLNYIQFLWLIITNCKNDNIKLIHCRGFPSVIIGTILKIIKKTSIIYDMRGFWVDEKKDNLSLDIKKKFDFLIYFSLKKIEKIIIKKADFIVVLTNKAKKYLNNNFNRKNKVFVIPCSVNYKQFNYQKYLPIKKFIYNKLKFSPNQKILVYVGSYGNYYLSKDVLDIYFSLKNFIKDFSLLIITNNKIEFQKLVKNIHAKDIRIINLNWNEIPKYLSICNISISLIKPTFAKIASTPTKISEALAMGLPVITNEGIGDLDDVIKSSNLGVFVNLKNIKEKTFSKKVLSFLETNKSGIRNRSRKYFDLEYTVKRYNKIYELFF